MTNLHIDSIVKSYDEKQILTDIFISTTEGEIIGLLGRNGSGKSTLLEIIFGSLSSESSFIRVDKERLTGIYSSHKHIKYLPQDSFLPSHLRVKKIIELFCDKDKVEKVKENPLISQLLDKTSKEISGGERRLVEVLLIIYSNAKYILLDEPFNGISPLYRKIINKTILEESNNKGFIITDHDYKKVLEIATRTILLYDGGVKYIKNKKELIDWGYTTKEIEN